MPRFYNKATSRVVKKTTMSESENLLYKKAVCTGCPMPLLVGVDQKHASYDRYLNYLRKNL